VLAVLFLLATARAPSGFRQKLPGAGLAVAAAIYAAFAIETGPGALIRVGLAATLAFTLLAAITVRRHAVLALGWILHIGWDVMHLRLPHGEVAPVRYPPLCIAFYRVVAVYSFHAGLGGPTDS